MPVPLDEYPIHQSPLSIAHMDTSDRNAYDRCYLNAHDRTGDVFLVTGLGQYPVEVIDPLHKLRLICDGDDHGVGFDLTWEGSFPTYDEARHTWRRNGR